MWSETIELYLREGRTVSGGCGPSTQMKNLNNSVQDFTKQVTSEAGTVFGDSNTVFNNIMSSVQSVVNGGPSQAGYSAEELNAMNAANVQNAGTMARNLKGAAASSGAAIGGGNAVAPAGSTQASVENAEIAAANTQAQGANQIVQNDYAQGNKNYEEAVGQETAAPGVFNTANSFNATAGNQQQLAEKSQQNIDSQNNWWKNDLMKLATTAAGVGGAVLTGGATAAIAGGISAAKAGSAMDSSTGSGWGDDE